MPTSAPELFHDWDLLQGQIMPHLLDVERSRHPQVLVMGPPVDALSVVLAYAHARQAASSRPHARRRRLPISLFVPTPRRSATIPAAIPARDARRLPSAVRDSCLHERDGHWIPRPEIAERVILADSPKPVDLVTFRAPDDRADGAAIDGAVARLRVGGQLLLAEASARAMPPGLVQVDEGGRIYRKEVDRPKHGRGHPAEATVTLARRQMETELIGRHVGLARSLTRRFVRRVDSQDDLEQVACLALVKAARRYDPSRETPFATFAAVSIVGELKRHLRDTSWALRVPRSVKERYLLVKRTQEDLAHQLGQSPSILQIADTLGATEEEVLEAIEAGDSYWPSSLDTGSDTGGTRDVPVTDRALDRSLDLHELQRFVPRLERRDQLILRRLYFDGCTQQEVADEIGVSQMQISRLNRQILLRLRNWLSAG